MNKDNKQVIDYDYEMKAVLILLVVCLILVAITIALHWDGWEYQINYIIEHVK
jgi:hypothetical protein